MRDQFFIPWKHELNMKKKPIFSETFQGKTTKQDILNGKININWMTLLKCSAFTASQNNQPQTSENQ